LLFTIAEKKIDEANFNSPLSFYEKEKILGINNKRENSILHEFLKQEKDKAEGFIPEFLEVSFGKIDKQNLPDEIKNIKVNGISISGKIDRVDLNPVTKQFRVIDYKLGGAKPSSSDLREGISIQLPLYIYAAKELIRAQLKNDFEPASAEIYSLKYKAREFGRLSVTDLSNADSIEEIVQICLETVEKYVDAISSGKFHLTKIKEREGFCRFCSFRSICRIEEKSNL
jgi:ATP-dependent helicase/nuclease subunit B